MEQFRKTIFILTLGVFMVLSCSKDSLREYDILQQKDAIESVNDPFLLTSIIKKTALFYQDQGYSISKLPGAVQYMERNVQGGDNTYSGFKTPATEMYDAMNILKLVDASIKLTQTRGSKVYEGIFTTFRVLLFSYMTDFYGDVYYSQALKGREGILYPKYDRQVDIYAGLLAELQNAKQLMTEGTELISPTSDVVYGGDKSKWIRFNNSLKLRLLMRSSGKLASAGTEISALATDAASLMVDNNDNLGLAFIGTLAENSWKGGTLNWSTPDEFDRRRPAKTLVDILASFNDPRLAVWVAPVEKPWTSDPAMNDVEVSVTDPNGFSYTSKWEYIDLTNPEISAQENNIRDKDKLYVGFIAGMASDFKNGNGHYDTQTGGNNGNFKVSKFSQLFRQNEHDLLKATVMNADEVQFILAEAAAKGLIPGNADAYYRKGIELSMKRWGIDDGDIATYLAQESIALPADQAGKLNQIATQKWLALFTVATETYLDLRRTRLPNIFSNDNLVNYTFPLRFRYPGDELGQNKDAYDAGVATLSPAVDDEFSKMWLLQ